MEGCSLRSAGKQSRRFHLGRFRSGVAALGSKGSQAELFLPSSRNDPALQLSLNGEKFEGSQEAVGTSSSKQSAYVVMRVDQSGKVMTVLPLDKWFSFKPAIKYATLSIEDVEREELRGGMRKLPTLKKEGGKEGLRERLSSKLEQACLPWRPRPPAPHACFCAAC